MPPVSQHDGRPPGRSDADQSHGETVTVPRPDPRAEADEPLDGPLPQITLNTVNVKAHQPPPKVPQISAATAAGVPVPRAPTALPGAVEPVQPRAMPLGLPRGLA